MRTKIASFGAALAALGILAVSSVASASSHREAPGISQDPVADNTDVWAWHTGDLSTGMLHVVASYNPFEEPAGGPNFHSFGDDVLYEIHVARGSKSLEDVVTYQLRFSTPPPPKVDPADLAAPLGGGKEFFTQISNLPAGPRLQTYTLTQVVNGTASVLVNNGVVAPANIGPRTNKVAYGVLDGQTYENAVALPKIGSFAGGGKVFAGPRDDGFYVDLGGFFDLANLRAFAGTQTDNLAGYNAHAIAIDIPAASLPGSDATDPFNSRFGVWASSSRRKMSVLRNDGSKQNFGPWVQVSRLGLPLINEVIIGLQDKDKYNRTQPKDDVGNFAGYILNPVAVRDAEAVGIYAALKVPDASVQALKKDRLDIVIAMNILSNPMEAGGFPLTSTGDVLRVDFGGKAGFPNGRPLGPALNNNDAKKENDVTDVLATIVLAGLQNYLDAATPGDPPGLLISDGVSSNDGTYTDSFPYLPTPWEGYSQGHGKPAP